MNAVCDPHWGPAMRRARAELFARIRRPHMFAVLLDGIQPVAGGLCVVDGELAGIFTLRTAVAARGRGHGRAVLRRLAAWGRGMGAQQLYLAGRGRERAGPGHGSAARRANAPMATGTGSWRSGRVSLRPTAPIRASS